MKKLTSILIFGLYSVFAFGQESTSHNSRYFVSTNSGVLKTPVGFRVGVLDMKGGYIGARFGKGDQYEKDGINSVVVKEGTLFSATAGLIFAISVRNNFKFHTFLGLGCGKWFERESNNGQTTGAEFEGGLMVSTEKILFSLGGNMLLGDGSSPLGDITLGLGYKF